MLYCASKKIGAWLLFAMVLMACRTSQKSIPETGRSMSDNSRTSLDWPGTYIGVLPCNDCEGTLTEVRLQTNGTYEVATQWLSKSKETHRKKGNFEWDAEGRTIRLSGAGTPSGDIRYQVVENALIQLDAQGKRIEGDMADMYRLVKHDANADVREKYWKLIELSGKPIRMKEGQLHEPHLILKFSGRVIGSTGCNRLMGAYTLGEGYQLRFRQIASTLMACQDVEYEGEFLRVLENVDNYTLRNDTLSLYKARTAAQARFVAVYLR